MVSCGSAIHNIQKCPCEIETGIRVYPPDLWVWLLKPCAAFSVHLHIDFRLEALQGI